MQKEIDEIYTKLVKFFLELRLILNKDLLNDLINQAESLDASKYTAVSWNTLSVALIDAKAVFNNPEATIEEVVNAEKVIEAAIKALVKVTDATNIVNSEKNVSVKTGDTVGLTSLTVLLGCIFVKKEKRIKRKF